MEDRARDVGFYKLAGLVASPVIHPGAFKDHDKAMKEWQSHQNLILYGVGGQDIERCDLRGCHKPYALQTNSKHKHYGCLAFIEGGIVFPRYVHSDYDLYALVDAEVRDKREEPTIEDMLGQIHLYGPKWFKIMMSIDKSLGYPMIFHGEQEHFKMHEKDDVIVFFPDGQRISILQGKKQIEDFYDMELKGRKAFEHPKPTMPGIIF